MPALPRNPIRCVIGERNIDLRARTLQAWAMNRDRSSFIPSFCHQPSHACRRVLSLLLALLCMTALSAFALDWPEYRGPWGNGNAAGLGDSKPLGLPLHWSETENVQWKTP